MQTTQCDPAVNTMNVLATYACSDSTSFGRRYNEPKARDRSEYQRDRDRIIHSAAFRRLEYKTQVFVSHEGDLFRTRLTHSVEVAQISRSVARSLGLNEDLTEAIALAHDLGHPPFGHAGQDVLNERMREYGGFEHNLQSLRIVEELEERYVNFTGLNLTFETREGIVKRCDRNTAKNLKELGMRFLTKRQPSLEAQLVNLADKITYVCHDVDDGLRAGLIGVEQLSDCEVFSTIYNAILQNHSDLPIRRIVHETVRRLTNHLVEDLTDQARANLARFSFSSPDEVRNHGKPLITLSPKVEYEVRTLKGFLYKKLYNHERVLSMRLEASRIIGTLFDLFLEKPHLLPETDYVKSRQDFGENGVLGKARVISDYIAGMTDRYAAAEYHRLVG